MGVACPWNAGTLDLFASAMQEGLLYVRQQDEILRHHINHIR